MKKLFLKFLLLFVVFGACGQPLLSMDERPSKRRRVDTSLPSTDKESEPEEGREAIERECSLVNQYDAFVDMFKQPVRLSADGGSTHRPEIFMPSDVVLEILFYLPQKERINTMLICRGFDRNVRCYYQHGEERYQPLSIPRGKISTDVLDWVHRQELKKLSFRRFVYDFDDEFCTALSHLVRLRSLEVTLCLPISELTDSREYGKYDSQFLRLSSAVGSLSSLECLSVFNGCSGISNAGLQKFSGSLGGLTGLQSLSVDFFECSISDADLQRFSGSLGGLVGLRCLSVDFSWCRDISDAGLQAFGRVLGGLTRLKSLSVDFNSCRGISDAGLQKFSGSLGGLRELQSLSVDFRGCRMSDTGLKSLDRALEGLKGLQSLSVNFCGCWISDADLQRFSGSLGGLVGLRCLSVNFSWCRGISDAGLQAFGRLLEGLRGLQSLSVDFDNCHGISDAGLEKFSRSLGGLSRSEGHGHKWGSWRR